MNVIILAPDFPPYSQNNLGVGGIGTYIFDFATGVHQNGHGCTVLCYQKDEQAERTFDRDLHFRTIRLKRFWRRYFRSPLIFLKLLSCTHKNNDNLFISGIGSLSHIPVFFSRFFAIKTATIIYGKDLLHIKNNKRIIQSLKRIDLIITISLYTKQLLCRLIGERDNIIIINPFFSPERFPEIDDAFLKETRTQYSLQNKKVILTTGRLIERKNHSLVIKTMKKIHEEFPEVIYLIIGEGPYKERLKERVMELKLKDHVQFLGFVTQKTLHALYDIADIFVMPSRETENDVEGFGIAFLEANYFGTPVIGTRTGGIPDAIEDGVNGLLISPDSDDELTEAVKKLLKDTSLYRTMKKQGRQRVIDKFLLEKTVNNALSGIKQLFEKG